MNPKFLLRLALVLSGSLFGCFSSAKGQTNTDSQLSKADVRAIQLLAKIGNPKLLV
ncbi:MAG TPA: hypothetical protein VJT54_09420 [Verrucomicrobiae bacterium]|nr:hypothetical protein [Verrucomicrobiae bacterium]